MNKILLLLASICFSYSFAQTNTEVDRITIKNAGALSEVVTLYAYDVEGNRHVGGAKKSYSKFDKNGNVIHQIFYNVEKQGIKEEWFYSYTKDNKVAKAIQKNGKGEEISSLSIQYNGKAEPILRKEKTNSSEFEISYKYNNGLLIEKKKTEKGKVVFTYKYNYSSTGKLSEEIFLDGEKTISTSFVYDANDYLTAKLISKNTELREKITFENNEQGLVLTEKHLSPFGRLLSTYKYTYNTNNLVSTITHIDHELKYEKNKWVYKYFENNLPKEVLTYDSGDSTPIFARVYSYKYPKK